MKFTVSFHYPNRESNIGVEWTPGNLAGFAVPFLATPLTPSVKPLQKQ